MRHTWKRYQSGQSAVLIAFMILVLVAMVGLSVDVSNAYGQQRRVQSITNAGAMAGMASAIANNTNNGVWTDVQRALIGNRTKINQDYTYTVDYILEDGTVEMLGEWNGSTTYVPSGNSYPPDNLGRIQVTMTERVKTKFANVVGRPTLGVTANGVACLGDYGFGVYPLAVPQTLQKPTYDFRGREQTSGHRIFFSNGQPLAESDSRWGKWSEMQGMTIRLPINQSQSDYVPGVHISTLNWGGDTQTVDGKNYKELSGQRGTSALRRAFTEPGTLQNGFMEAVAGDSAKPNTKPIGTLQRGDWIAGDTGVKAGVDDAMQVLVQRQTKVMLPMYDATGSRPGSAASYHMVNMGLFMMRYVQFQTGTKYIDLVYLGNASASPTECGSEAPDSISNPKQFNVKGDVKLNRVWRTGKSSGSTTYDIVVVMDTSESMRYDWQDRDPGSLTSASRMNDAKRVIRDFVQNYDIVSQNGDPDARIAFVTFGGNTAVVQAPFQTACVDTLIPTDCGLKTAKWATIQTKAAAMTPYSVTPGPIGFEAVETLLKNKRTPPAGKKYAQIVIFATDGVFNVCGKDKGERNCPYGGITPQEGNATQNDVYYNPSYNMVSGRPVWQAQQVASRIKNSGAKVFIIALTPTCLAGDSNCFNPAGLSDMSSGSKYYYQANDASALTSIYGLIGETIVNDTCVPNETTQQAANATIVLTKPDNPTWSKTTITNSAGAFQFSNLQSGQYIVKVEPSVVLKSGEDGLTRTYSRTRNGRSLSEEGQASVYINPQFPNGASVSAQLLVGLPLASDGGPNNGCTMPAP